MHYEHILVTTDLSDNSLRAFEYAAYQAKMEGSKVTVLYALEDWVVPAILAQDLPYPAHLEEYRKSQQALAIEKISAIVAKSFHGLKPEVCVEFTTEPVAQTVVRVAKRCGADLLVMTTHGQGALSTALLGSVIQRVLQQAPCPVLVIPRVVAKKA